MKKKIPFDFVLDVLAAMNPVTRPMFGCYAVYIGAKIVLILRSRPEHEEANGVWIATAKEHHESLKKEFSSLRSIDLLSGGKSETSWQMLPAEADDFENSVMKVCELILRNNARIGNIPKQRKKKK